MSEIDTDTSGDISDEELEAFMSTGNRDEVIDVLVNHKNPLYDHKLSVEEFSMWRAKQNETKFNENKPGRPEVDTKNPEDSGETTGNFDHVNKGGYVTLNGVSVQKGSFRKH